jgi:hypothetical protein
MKTLTLFGSFFLLLINIGFSQYTEIVIDDNNSPNEPAIQINPYNTDQLVAGANIESYYYSEDGGYTWSEGYLTSTYGVWGDPVIACDTNGDFYFFHLSNPDVGNWIDRIVCQKSTDGGVSWNNGTYAGLNGIKAQDKHWTSIDRNNNFIYLTWTQFDLYGSTVPEDSSHIMFSRSEDAGETWTPAIRINKTGGDCLDDDHTVEGAVPVVGPNGEVYVAWAGRKTTGDDAIIFDKSTDGGDTWLNEDVFVTDFPGGWAYDIPGIYRCNGLPVVKCDTTGGIYNGTIYINWTDQQNGPDDTDVWLTKSIDGGETWSEKIRVNDDEPGKQQFFTWFDIDQTNGKLYFIFYDRRNYNDSKTDVYMAVSEDGGETFQNIKISETPFNPSSSVFFGDYTNICVYNNKIAPIWARADGSSMSLRTVVFDQTGIKNDIGGFPDRVYPNPSSTEFYYSFKVRDESIVNIFVTDIFGNTITYLINNENIEPGKYILTFDARQYHLKPGVYFFNYHTDGTDEVRKIIYQHN